MFGAAVLQTFAILCLICIADEWAIISSLLMTAQITRVLLTLIGLIQSINHQISFYHLSILSTLCHLLSIPEYLVIFTQFLPNWYKHERFSLAEKMLNIIGLILGATLNFALGVVWAILSKQGLTCLLSSHNDPLHFIAGITANHAPIQFSGQQPALRIPCIFVTLFTVTLTVVVFYCSKGYTAIYRIGFIFAVSYAIFVTMSLVSTIRWLDEIATDSQRNCGFGQMISIASGGLTVVMQLVNYSNATGPADSNIPRYHHWCLSGMLLGCSAYC